MSFMVWQQALEQHPSGLSGTVRICTRKTFVFLNLHGSLALWPKNEGIVVVPQEGPVGKKARAGASRPFQAIYGPITTEKAEWLFLYAENGTVITTITTRKKGITAFIANGYRISWGAIVTTTIATTTTPPYCVICTFGDFIT